MRERFEQDLNDLERRVDNFIDDIDRKQARVIKKVAPAAQAGIALALAQLAIEMEDTARASMDVVFAGARGDIEGMVNSAHELDQALQGLPGAGQFFQKMSQDAAAMRDAIEESNLREILTLSVTSGTGALVRAGAGITIDALFQNATQRFNSDIPLPFGERPGGPSFEHEARMETIRALEKMEQAIRRSFDDPAIVRDIALGDIQTEAAALRRKGVEDSDIARFVEARTEAVWDKFFNTLDRQLEREADKRDRDAKRQQQEEDRARAARSRQASIEFNLDEQIRAEEAMAEGRFADAERILIRRDFTNRLQAAGSDEERAKLLELQRLRLAAVEDDVSEEERRRARIGRVQTAAGAFTFGQRSPHEQEIEEDLDEQTRLLRSIDSNTSNIGIIDFFT
jgi:hypothetical protein